MLNATVLLTLATLLGLVAGFAREWLLVADWGAGARTDAFLVGMFVTEALRMTLGGGLLSAAALPLWNKLPIDARPQWMACQFRHWSLVGLGLAALLSTAAPWLVRLIGPGLAVAQQVEATIAMRCLALAIPALLLQALLAIPSQAAGRFLLPGLASLLFNLPAVAYLSIHRVAAREEPLSLCFVAGSVIAVSVLVPALLTTGWRPFLRSREPRREIGQVWARLLPLLASSGASQGLALLERLAASLLGEGTITLVNLARKLINIPLIALMSLNQVLLARMSEEGGATRLTLLRQGLKVCTLLTLPSVVALIAAAPALVALLLPAGLAQGPLPALLACYSVAIVFGSWNALLARFSYAGGDTRSPLLCELTGSGVQASLLFLLPMLVGVDGLAIAAVGGVIFTGLLLTHKLQRDRLASLIAEQMMILLLLAGVAATLFHNSGHGPWYQLGLAGGAAAVVMLMLGLQWRSWRFSRRSPLQHLYLILGIDGDDAAGGGR